MLPTRRLFFGERPRSRRRLLPRRRHVLAAIVGLILLAVAVYAYWTFADAAPVDLSDLSPRYSRDADVENGFRHLDRHESEIWLPAEYPWCFGGGAGIGFDCEGPESAWSPELGAEVVAKNEAALEAFRLALTTEHIQPPMARSLDDRVLYLYFLRRLVAVVNEKVWSLYRAGRGKEALELAFDQVELGSRLQAATTPAVGFFTGTAFAANGLRNVALLMMNDAVVGLPHHDVLERLRRYSDVRQFAVEDLKVELEVFRHTVFDVLYGVIPKEERQTGFLLPNETVGQYAEDVREAIRALNTPWEEYTEPDVEFWKTPVRDLGIVRIPLPWRNAVGRRIYGMVAMDLRRLVEQALRFEAMCGAVRLLVAIREYRSEHGGLPQDLDKLVPEHIESIPQDPFVGEPLRYDAARRVIYSVGPDGIDDRCEVTRQDEEDQRPIGMLVGDEEGELVLRFEFPTAGG